MLCHSKLPLEQDDVVADRYWVEHAIGVGGMGSVVAAYDAESGARVAIKCILPHHAKNREVRTRFAREARVSGFLKSEHIARVLDRGEVEVDGEGLSYLVMDHLDGTDLKSLMRSMGQLPLEEAAEYVRQASVALAEAHALGIVHRDLKPANLFRTYREDGSHLIKVLDFGIAKFASPNVAGDDMEMTADQMMIGSRAYMSPEQMLDAKSVDARADIWALGVILFFLLTGELPFSGETSSDVALAILQGEPRSLTAVRPDVPVEVEQIVNKCLAKYRDDRLPNVVELSRALEPFARPIGTSDALLQMGARTMPLPREGLVVSPEPPIPTDRTLTATSDFPPPPMSRRRRNSFLLATAGVAVALTVAASAVAYSAHRVPPPVNEIDPPALAPR